MMEKPKMSHIGNLDAIRFPHPDPKALTVVCLHGYGADMNDLAPLAQELTTKRPLAWLFPNAPQTLDWGGRAWFPIDIAAFEESQRTGKPRDLSRREPESMAGARKELQLFLKELDRPLATIVLMGFSQGAMMAVDLALRADEMPAGVAILSGTLVDGKNMAVLAAKKRGLSFFQTHGSADPILGFAQALELEKILTGAGWIGKLQRFEGGHGIPPEATAALRSWLEAL